MTAAAFPDVILPEGWTLLRVYRGALSGAIIVEMRGPGSDETIVARAMIEEALQESVDWACGVSRNRRSGWRP